MPTGIRCIARPAVAVAASPPRAPSCPDGMVLIPASTFWMGSSDGEGEADEHPLLHVRLDAYCMDRTEVTVRSYRACIAGQCVPQRTINWQGMTARDQEVYNPTCNLARDGVEEHPVNCIDWTNADAYCRSRGARLPTEAEWEHAARGNEANVYPWGNSPPGPTLLNACGGECQRWASERNMTWNPLYPGDDGWPTTAPVGSYPAGASPFGLLDMAGNVWEWTADWYSAGYNYRDNPVFNPTGAAAGTTRADRGGGWRTYALSWVRAAHRDWVGTAHRSNLMGFRCARGAN